MVVALLVLVAIVLYSDRSAGIENIGDLLAVRISVKNALILAAFLVCWPTALTIAGAYTVTNARTLRDVVARVVAGCSLGSLLAVIVLLTSRTGMLGIATIPVFWALAVWGTLAVRLATRAVTAGERVRSAPQRVVIAGTGPRAVKLWSELRRHPLVKYELVATADLPGAEVAPQLAGRPTVSILELENFLMHTVVDEVIVALPVRSCYEEIQQVLGICEHAGVHSLYLADAFSPTIARAQMTQSGGFSVVSMHVVRNDWRLVVKRAFDIIVASVALVVVSPLIACIALGIRMTSPGNIIFAQERYGYHKRRFKMFKFRTMVTDAEQLQASLEEMNELDGPVFKIARDPRVTPFGSFLRKTSLDELPQLWNIVRGDMSIVGPRPLPIRDVSRFEEPWLMRRFSVTPGLTGLWQVSGRSNVGFSEWVKFDLEYIDTWSLRLDFRILARTVPVVFRGLGAM
jgi:exopolysaccharide biosynthesis polyprenyl glycosylphosphotransferase